MVDAHDEHGGIVLGGGGHDHLLGAGVDVGLGLLLGQEHAGGLHYILGAHLAPGDVLGIHAGEELHSLAVDDDGVVGVLNGAVKLAVHGIITQHVGHVIGGHEGIVDTHELDVGTGDTRAEHQTADPAKAINANFNAHNESLLRSNLILK